MSGLFLSLSYAELCRNKRNRSSSMGLDSSAFWSEGIDLVFSCHLIHCCVTARITTLCDEGDRKNILLISDTKVLPELSLSTLIKEQCGAQKCWEGKAISVHTPPSVGEEEFHRGMGAELGDPCPTLTPVWHSHGDSKICAWQGTTVLGH